MESIRDPGLLSCSCNMVICLGSPPVGAQVIQRKGIDPTWTVQMVAAIHISLEEAHAVPVGVVGYAPLISGWNKL